mgnify:CR=1 FL=1
MKKLLDILKNLVSKLEAKEKKQVEEPAKVENPVEEIDDVHCCCICGVPETEVNMVIRSNNDQYICEKCASLIHFQIDEINKYTDEVNQMLAEQTELVQPQEQPKKELKKNIKDVVPTPHEIKEFLDEYVIGQDQAKIKLAVAVYNHYKRLIQKDDETTIEKSNLLLLGHTGCGKSELVKTIAKLLDVPMVIVGATCFTQAGYVGEDVESILSRLYQAAGDNLEKAERGIVFIDEIDKIAKQGDSPSITKDVSGEGVQQALLKMFEGSKIKFSPNGGRKHPEKEMIEIDTNNILFVCSGAFVGIEKRIEKRLNMRAIGFAADTKKNVSKENIIEYLTPEDVRAYGMIPELVGRLPIITYVKNLTKEELRQVLTEPKNSIIKQYIKLFKMDGVKLEFEDAALDYIVEKAMTLKTGARGLRSIVEEIMTQYMYDIPSTKKRKLIVTKEYAEKAYEAKQSYRESANN